MRGIVEVFRKDPAATWDYEITFAIGAGATLKGADPAPTVTITDCQGNAVSGAGAPVVSEIAIIDGQGSEVGSKNAISFRVAGGVKGEEYFLTAKADVSDGRVAAKTIWLVTDAPLGEAEDTAVIRMGSPSGVTADQLRTAIAAETRARVSAIDELRGIVDANTAKRVRSFTTSGRNVILGTGEGNDSISVELPNSVVGMAYENNVLTATHIDGSTTKLNIVSGGGGGAGDVTTAQLNEAIAAATRTLRAEIPVEPTALRALWALRPGSGVPPTPVIPPEKLMPVGAGFVAGDVVVAPWGQTRPSNVPDGQTLWMVSVIMFADNSTIVGPPQAVHELSAADMTAIGSLTALAARVAVNDAKRAAALWAQDRGDGSTQIPDTAIRGTIARDSELSELIEGAALDDGLLTLTRHDGNNPIQLRIFPAGGNNGEVLKLVNGERAWAVDEAGSGGAPDSITSLTVGVVGGQTQITTRTRGGSSNAYVLRLVPETDAATAGQVLTVVGTGFEWRTLPVFPDLSTYATIARVNADLATRDSEIANLSEIVFANLLPDSLRAIAPDISVTPHPAGVWEQTADSTVKMNIGGAFLFDNLKTGRLTVPQEIDAVSGYSIANLTGMNWVREHGDPNEDSNPWRGVTPYATGPLPVTTPANLRRKVLTFFFGQSSAERSASNNLTAETEFLRFGTAGLLRFNRGGLWARIGSSSAVNRQITHFLRVGQQNLSSLGDGNQYVLNALATTFTGATRKLKLTADLYEADESVSRSSSSVEVTAAAAPANFSIPIAGRTPLRGNVSYNGATRVITINITGGSKEPDSHIVLNVGAEVTENYTRPARVEYTGLLAADSLTPGNAEVFTQNHLNQAVFSFEQVYDEPPGPDNLMKLVWRINDLHHTTFLHQTRAQLQLDSTDIRVGSTLTYISHLQVGTAGELLSEGDLRALQVGVKGWGQLHKNHRDDNVDFRALVAAHGLAILNEDGSRTSLVPVKPWAVAGSTAKIPASEVNREVTNPAGVLHPRVISVFNPTFENETFEQDLGRADGPNGWREQYEAIEFFVEYKQGNQQTGGNNPVSSAGNQLITKHIRIPVDIIPSESTIQGTNDSWTLPPIIIAKYPNTAQQLVVRLTQANQRQGNILNPIGNIKLQLFYQNNNNGRFEITASRAAVTHYDFLAFARIPSSAVRHIFLMPRNAQGNEGPEGPEGPQGRPGIDGARGLPGQDGQDGSDGSDGAAGQGVAAGGTKDQVLAKRSNSDFDTHWVTAANNTGGGGGGTVDAAVSNRIGFALAGIDTAGVTRAALLNTVNRASSTARNANVNQAGRFHKLSFAVASTAGFGTVDANGNIRFANNDYKNLLLRIDFSLAQIAATTNSARIELGLLIVQLNANGSRTLRKESIGQYMRNNANDPPFRTANVLIERSLTLPDSFNGETWEVYLFAESQVTSSQLRINARYDHATSAPVDALGGGAYLLGVDDAVATAASTGGGGGLDQAAVDARIAAQTKVYARSGQRAIAIGDVDAALAARLLPATGGADGKLVGFAGGMPQYVDPPSTADQTARDAAASAQTDATEALTRAGTANDTATQAKATADAAATKNTQQDEAIAEAQTTATGAVNKNTAQDTAISAADTKAQGAVDKNTAQDTAIAAVKSTADASATKNTEQDAAIAAIRQVPAGGTAGQILAVDSGGSDLEFINAPSGGGGATVGVGPLTSLGISPLVLVVRERTASSPHQTIAVDLSGDVDSIVIEFDQPDGLGVQAEEIAAPFLSVAQSYDHNFGRPTASPTTATSTVTYSITGTGSASQIRVDSYAPGAGGVSHRIRQVFKRLKLTGTAPPAGATDTTARTAAARAQTTADGAVTKNTAQDTAISAADTKAQGAVDKNTAQDTAITTAQARADAAHDLADAATTEAEATALIKPFARAATQTKVPGNVLADNAITRAKIAADAVDGSKIAATTPLTTTQAAAVDQKIRAIPAPVDSTARRAAAAADTKAQGAVDKNELQDSAIQAVDTKATNAAGLASTADGKATEAKTAADAAQATADAATTPAEVNILIRPFARADRGSNFIQSGDIASSAINRRTIAPGAVDGSKIDAQTPLTTAQTADVNRLIAAHESDNSHPDDGLNQSQVRSEIDSRVESFARVGSGVNIPASRVPGAATTAALAQVAVDVAANTRKTGLPANATEGQVPQFKNNQWVAADPAAQTSPAIDDSSIEPKKLRARILEQVLQHGSKADNFSVYTFGNSGDNFEYKGVTGRVDRARLEIQQSVFELRWTGFANRQQLSGLMVRITSGTSVQEFAADSGTDFSLGESSYLNVSTAGLSTRPLAIDVYIAEHDDLPKSGEVFIVNDDDSGEWKGHNELVADTPAVKANTAAVEANRLAASAADAKGVQALARAQQARDEAQIAQTAADEKLDQAQVDARVAARVKPFAAAGGRQIAAEDIGPNAVGTSELADRQVTGDKLAGGAVVDGKIGHNAINTTNIKDGVVTAAKIAPGVIPPDSSAAAAEAKRAADGVVGTANNALAAAQRAETAAAEKTTPAQATALIKPFARTVGTSGARALATADIPDLVVSDAKIISISPDKVRVDGPDGYSAWSDDILDSPITASNLTEDFVVDDDVEEMCIFFDTKSSVFGRRPFSAMLLRRGAPTFAINGRIGTIDGGSSGGKISTSSRTGLALTFNEGTGRHTLSLGGSTSFYPQVSVSVRVKRRVSASAYGFAGQSAKSANLLSSTLEYGQTASLSINLDEVDEIIATSKRNGNEYVFIAANLRAGEKTISFIGFDFIVSGNLVTGITHAANRSPGAFPPRPYSTGVLAVRTRTRINSGGNIIASASSPIHLPRDANGRIALDANSETFFDTRSSSSSAWFIDPEYPGRKDAQAFFLRLGGSASFGNDPIGTRGGDVYSKALVVFAHEADIMIPSGGQSVVLPENFPTFGDVSLAASHTGTGETRIGKIDTGLLAAMATITNLRVSGTTDLSWNRSTRTLSIVGGSTNGTIIYARLK